MLERIPLRLRLRLRPASFSSTYSTFRPLPLRPALSTTTRRPHLAPCPVRPHQHTRLSLLSTMSSSSSSSSSSSAPSKPLRLAIIGSGNWGSAIARIAGENVKRYPDQFEESVKMYVYEEEIKGRKLTEIINSEHENVKYLPGIKLPTNVKAVPSAVEAASGADLLIFVLPHQVRICVCHEQRSGDSMTIPTHFAVHRECMQGTQGESGSGRKSDFYDQRRGGQEWEHSNLC